MTFLDPWGLLFEPSTRPSVRPLVHNNFSLSNGESPWYFPSSPPQRTFFPSPDIFLFFHLRYSFLPKKFLLQIFSSFSFCVFSSPPQRIFFPSPNISLLYLLRLSSPPQNNLILSPFFFSFADKNIYCLFKHFPRFLDIKKSPSHISFYSVPYQ